MKNRNKNIPFILIILVIITILLLLEKQQSYSEPQEALLATEDNLLLVPAYYIEDEALFFFIKNRNNLGASFVGKGFFGWKAGMLTWSSMKDHYEEKLNGYQRHGENLIYGILKGREGEGFIVKVNENEANILNLAMLPTEVITQYQLENLSIWYFESETAIEEGEIKLINKETDQEIDIIEL